MIRELLPDAAIGTDLIAGFPGETTTRSSARWPSSRRVRVTYVHVFPYSVRQGTTAAKFDGRNPRATVTDRARRCAEVCDRKRAAFAQRFDGTVAEVLVETTARSAERASCAATPATTCACGSTARTPGWAAVRGPARVPDGGSRRRRCVSELRGHGGRPRTSLPAPEISQWR